MAKGLYIGVDGKARKVKKIYTGINGKARKVKKQMEKQDYSLAEKKS